MTRSTKFIILVLVLIAAGWTGIYFWLRHALPPNAITLTLNQDSYQPGQDIILTVTNNTNQTLKVENECPREPLRVEYREHNEWQEQSAERADQASCTDNNKIELPAHASKQINYQPWQQELFKQPGDYRLNLELEGYETSYQKELHVVAPNN